MTCFACGHAMRVEQQLVMTCMVLVTLREGGGGVEGKTIAGETELSLW